MSLEDPSNEGNYEPNIGFVSGESANIIICNNILRYIRIGSTDAAIFAPPTSVELRCMQPSENLAQTRVERQIWEDTYLPIRAEQSNMGR